MKKMCNVEFFTNKLEEGLGVVVCLKCSLNIFADLPGVNPQKV
jgi:hypothetical protein